MFTNVCQWHRLGSKPAEVCTHFPKQSAHVMVILQFLSFLSDLLVIGPLSSSTDPHVRTTTRTRGTGTSPQTPHTAGSSLLLPPGEIHQSGTNLSKSSSHSKTPMPHYKVKERSWRVEGKRLKAGTMPNLNHASKLIVRHRRVNRLLPQIVLQLLLQSVTTSCNASLQCIQGAKWDVHPVQRMKRHAQTDCTCWASHS